MVQRDAGTSALLEDYKLKVEFAVNQINRLQGQFQLLLTVEAAIATALIAAMSRNHTDAPNWIALLEIVLSIAWLVLGWNGRSLAVSNRRDLEQAGLAWAASAGFHDAWRPVGYGRPVLRVAVAVPATLTVCWVVILVTLTA